MYHCIYIFLYMHILFSSLLCVHFVQRLYERFPRAANTASIAFAWNATATTTTTAASTNAAGRSASSGSSCQPTGVPGCCSGGSKAFSTIGSGCSGCRSCCHGVRFSPESQWGPVDSYVDSLDMIKCLHLAIHTHLHTATFTLCKCIQATHTQTHKQIESYLLLLLLDVRIFISTWFRFSFPHTTFSFRNSHTPQTHFQSQRLYQNWTSFK